MGVQNLWQILAPVKSEASIESLQGKKIAVDLAIWLVESQVTGMKMMQGRVVKPHLRNLFFRVSNFLRLGVKLIFVIDGTPPELKWEEMARRNEARLGGGGGGGRGRWRGRGRGGRGGGVKKASRSHFACWLKECQELLELMGVPCIQSKGEAEAMCAALNSSGIVDGCMTEDGDAFLYGACVVYRNLNMATGQVDCYSMDDIETDLDLDRRRLVALAILLGCDYLPKGVPGIGKEVAMRFMSSLPSSVDPLKLFEDWSRGCDSACSTNVERDVRKKSLRVEGFPNQDVIKEFLDNKERPPAHHTEWRRPLLQHLQQFNLVKIEWPHEYTQEKVVPLVTLYDLTHMTSDPRGCLHPAAIVKLRVRQGVQCVEVKWHRPDEDKENDEDAEPYYTTVEERALFTSAYPDIMEQFLVAMETKKTRGRGKKKKEPSSSLQQGGATEERQSSADVGVMLENEQPHDHVSLLVSQVGSYDRDKSKLRNRDLGSDCETTTDGKSKFAVERHRSGDTDDEGMLMKLINLSLHDSKTQESMEGRGEPQGNGAAIADGGRRQKRTQDRKNRTKSARNCLKGKETRLGKQPPAEGALEELSTLKNRSLPVVPAVIMKSQDRKQAMKEIQQVNNDNNTEEKEEEDGEKLEAEEEESFMEVLPLSQRLGCHSLRGFVPSSRITGKQCSSGVSSNAAKSASHLSSDSESDLEIPETSPLSCDEEILETNPAEIKPLEFSLAGSNKEIKRARDSSEARTRSEQFHDEESPDTVPVEIISLDLTFEDVDKKTKGTNHASGIPAESKWPHVDSPCEHSGRRSQEGHIDQKLFMAKEMAETTSKLEIVQTLDMQLNSPPASNQDTKISVVHPSCHQLTTATHEVIDLTEDSPLDDKCIATVHSAEEAAIHQSPSAETSDVPSRSLDEKSNDDDKGRPDRSRLDKISGDQESSNFSVRKNVSSFMKLDSSLAKFMDELSLVSYSASAAASFTESDDSVFIVEDGEPCSDERTHADEKNEEKEEKCVSSCEGTVEGRSMGIQELFPASEALDKIGMIPEEKVNDTAVKSEPTVQEDQQDGTEHHRKEPMNVHMISDCKSNSKIDCLFVTKQAINVKLEDGELCRKETNNINKETLECVMTATFNSVEASERPSCKPQRHKEVPLSSTLHKQMENLSPPVLLGKKKVKPRRGHVSKAKKRHKMMKSSSLNDSVRMENDLMKILQTMSPLSILPNFVSQGTTGSLSETSSRSKDPSSQLLWLASQEGRPCPKPMCFSPSASSPSVTTSCSSSTSSSALSVTPNLPNLNSPSKSDQPASLVPKVPCAILADSVAGLHVSPCTNSSHLRRTQLLSMLSQLTPGDSPLMDLKVLKNPQRSVRNCVGHQNLNGEGNQSTSSDSVDTDSVPCRDVLKQSTQQNHVRELIHNEIDCGCKCITSKSKVHAQRQNCLPDVCVGHKSEVRIQKTQLQGTRNVPKSKSQDKPRLKPKPRSLSQPTRTVKRTKGSRHTSCSQPAGSHTTSRSRSRSKSSVKHFQRRESVLEMECGLAKILEGLVTE